MSTDQKSAEQSVPAERRKWPVSLLGCFESSENTAESQESWPWFMTQALLCPAAALGANETLFQEEEPADVGCLQPHSLCGPTCRELNAQLCGFGNEGLRLCAHTCLLQAACSWNLVAMADRTVDLPQLMSLPFVMVLLCSMCLGLPLIAWLTTLQRQRVVTKHMLDDGDEEDWVKAALYPCSLLQMHTLLQQQQQQHQQQPTGQAAAAYKAPQVQQMAVAEPSCASQAPSIPGPLTSAMSTSRIMRAVRTQSAQGPGSRLDDSISSDTSSGVVDKPQGQQSHEFLLQAEDSVMCELEDRVVTAPSAQQQQQQLQQCQDERQTAHLLQHCVSSSSSRHPEITEGPLHMGTTCLSARSANNSRLASPRPSSRGGAGSATPAAVTAAVIEEGPLSARRRLQQMQNGSAMGNHTVQTPSRAGLPPKHRKSTSGHPLRPTSSNGGANGAAAGSLQLAVAGTMPCPLTATSPEPQQCLEASSAAAASPLQPSSTRHSIQDAAAVAAVCGEDKIQAALDRQVSCSVEHRRSSSAGAGLGTCGDNLSSSRLSIGACSASKLQLSQEDVPLMAIKPTPGRAARGMSTGLSSSRGTMRQAGLNGSWQGSSGTDRQLPQTAGDGSSANSEQSSRCASDCGNNMAGTVYGASVAQQVHPQYATVQSDICNYASWLGGAGVSTANLYVDASTVHMQHQVSTSLPLSRQDSMQDRQQQELVLAAHQQQQQQQELSRHSSIVLTSDDDQPASRQGSEVMPTNIVAAKVSSSPVARGKPAAKASLVGPGSVQQSSSILNHAGCGRARMSDWAYMSDLCNLGGSFEANVSTYGGGGLAAALGRLAEEGYDLSNEEGGEDVSAAVQSSKQHPAVNAQAVNSGVNGRNSSSGLVARQQGQQLQRCSARVASGSWPDAAPSPPSTLHDTLDSQPASISGGADSVAASTAAPSAEVSAGDCSGSAGRPAPAKQSASQLQQSTSVPKVRTSAGSAMDETHATSSEKVAVNSSSAGRWPLSIDKEMLAAVTGGTGTDDLTTSQAELATKLAKLAFANPAAARRLAGQRPEPQQQKQQGKQQQCTAEQQHYAGAAELVEADEPFYPTMMSDMCNLAEPLTDDEQETAAEHEGTQRLLSAAQAASIAQQSILQGLVSNAAQRRQQLFVQQQKQQQQQQRSTAGRLGGPAAGAIRTGPLSAGAGPLKSALLTRGGPKNRPGIARPVNSSAGTAAVAAAGLQRPAAQTAAPAFSGASNSCFTLESFDSYYPDCEVTSALDAQPNAKGRTYTVTPMGMIIETPGLNHFASGGSSRASSPAAMAAAAWMVSTGVGSSPPKSPKRGIAAARSATTVGMRHGVLHCESAAAAAIAEESDVRSSWQADVSRGASPAVAVSAEAVPAAGDGAGLKGLLGVASVQTSNSLWPVVDASAVASSRK